MSHKVFAQAQVQRSGARANHKVQRKPLPVESLALSSRAVVGLQPALRVGRVNDACELQADAVADKVVAGETAVLNQTRIETPQLQPLKKVETEEESETLQAQTKNEDEALQARIEDEEEEHLQAQAEQEEEELQAQAQTEEQEEGLQALTEEEEEELQAQADEEEENLQARAEDEEEALQARLENNEEDGQLKAASEAVPVSQPDLMRRAKSAVGSPLPTSVKDRMERAFQLDFSGVRIHQDEAAVALNQGLGARALTSANHIFFNHDEFAPQSREGQHLLAHELTHTVQQGKAGTSLQPKAQDDEQYLIRPELLDAVNLARSQIGLVNAKQTDQDGNRIGWQRLEEFFKVAFGGQHPLNPSVIQKRVMLDNGDKTKKDALPSWCGIFVWWSLKSAGVPIADWKLGQSVMQHLVARKPGETPRKGDIAYRAAYQHFAIVSGVKSDNGKTLVATINGNTSGEDNLGGQIQEQWHSPSQWLGFFDPVAALKLPEVELVSTTFAPDAAFEQPQDEPVTVPEPPGQTETRATEAPLAQVAEIPSEAESTQAGSASEQAVSLELPDIPPAPPMEATAKIESLQFAGKSEQAVDTAASASPSQLALEGHKLGDAVAQKLSTEQQHEVASAPSLQVNLAGNVDEGFVQPEALAAGNTELQSAGDVGKPQDLEAQPHQNLGDAPSNKAGEQELEKQSRGGGFLDWLRANISKFMNAIRTRDPNLNTSAGSRQKVALEGASDPMRMVEQRQEAGGKLRDKRDEISAKLQAHPGQGNIKARAVQQSKPVTLKPESSAPVVTEQANEARVYAEAALPQEIRDKADETLARSMQKNLDKAGQDARGAAQTRDSDKKNAVDDAERETAELNKQADNDQKTLVIDNRKQVSQQQSLGITQAFEKTRAFETDAGKAQGEANKAIGDEVRTSEQKADNELKKGEADAEAKKLEGEKEAREKKEKLEREQKNESWWDRAKNAIKNAVKAITDAIGAVFNKIREAVKTIIEKAKQLAIDAINAARNFVVDKLNKFRDWAKEQVNSYLGEHFPAIAAAINGVIDGVVDVAIAGVNMVADGAIAAVEAVANALAAALDKILSVFQAALKAAVQIIGAVLTGDFLEALKIAIRTGCEIAGIDSQPIFDFFDRAGKQLVEILKSPGKFFNNLVSAIGMGVRNFVKNIKQHLIKGLIGWLTGALSEANITLPETFDVKGIFSLVMQILGLTYANIKARVIKRYPPAEKVINAIEKGVEIIHLLLTKGPIALWEMVKQSMANLKEMVMGAIRNFVITTVIKEAVTWLLGLLNPAGALVKILKLLFDLVMFLVERFQQIKHFVLSVYGAITSIASGVLGKAAAAVENAMARSLPVVIGLLASLAGLGGIGKTIQGIIKKVTQPINKVIDKVIDKVVAFAKKLFKKGKQAAKKVKQKLLQWWKVKRSFKASNGDSHSLFLKGQSASARLTMRSAETPFQNFLNSLDESGFTGEQKTHFKNAQATAKKIDEEKKSAVGGKTDAEKEQNAKEKEKRLGALLEQLGKDTAHLFQSDDLPKWSYAQTVNGVNGAGFAKSMEVTVLAKKQPGWQRGTAPTQAKQVTYDVLNLRRQSGGASFYIRGHLLNDNLGGLGQWENMTPLSREGNHQHEAQVESFVKAGFESGAVQRYKVLPDYAGQGNGQALKDGLKAKYPTQSATFDRIIDAEEQVPVALKIEAATLKKKGKQWVDQKKQSWNLKNPIKRSVDQYFLSDSPKIISVNLKTLGSTQPLLHLQHAAITPQAGPIMQAILKRRADDKLGWFPSYAALADATNASGGSTSETQLSGWSKQGYIQLK
jgi:hypothetical protein